MVEQLHFFMMMREQLKYNFFVHKFLLILQFFSMVLALQTKHNYVP